MIPEIDFEAMRARDAVVMSDLRDGARDIGFLTLHNTPLKGPRVQRVIHAYRSFFQLPQRAKEAVDMARTGSNRGWGAPGSEQVDPHANPDYKQVFDCGFELAADDPLRAAALSVYADNQWPAGEVDFRAEVQAYYTEALSVAQHVLTGIAAAIGADEAYFADKFTRPMALLRGNYYPPRPDWAGEKDFGIATHTDYGCITLLATDGTPGLEVRKKGGGWIPVTAQPGTFVINFGEMLEMWTEGAVRATPHRVVGGSQERISVPLFFNPNHDANVASPGQTAPILAGAHLARRFSETYTHLQKR
ncbi:isopenicillin N synthase family dioxygenase [Primorskyibacter sp. S187A]|uniref:isopenicillin N synthase family dioxygenase n=1 Tax=Primorskyibacter sp. S187A TaxID=3415130 RepID=UPI003C7BC264